MIDVLHWLLTNGVGQNILASMIWGPIMFALHVVTLRIHHKRLAESVHALWNEIL
jgi:hypothetical protein